MTKGRPRRRAVSSSCDVHQEAAVAADADDLAAAAARERRGDGRRQTEAHGGEPVADEHRVRLARLPEARHPELVGADVADEDVLRPHQLAQVVQHALRLDREVLVGAGVEDASEGAPVRPAPRMLATALPSSRPRELEEDAGEVADELDLGDEVGVDLRRHRVDADDALPPVRVPGGGRPLDHVVADADHEVGAAHDPCG